MPFSFFATDVPQVTRALLTNLNQIQNITFVTRNTLASLNSLLSKRIYFINNESP